jgi:hypothetical protein
MANYGGGPVDQDLMGVDDGYRNQVLRYNTQQAQAQQPAQPQLDHYGQNPNGLTPGQQTQADYIRLNSNGQNNQWSLDQIHDNRQNNLIGDQQSAIQKFDRESSGVSDNAVRRKNLATQRAMQNRIRGIRSEAASRGLLNSGSRELAEANVRGVGAEQQVNNQVGVNRALSSIRMKMQALYDKLRFDKYEESVITADDLYNQALYDSASASQDQAQMLQAGAGFAGMAYGAQQANRNTATPQQYGQSLTTDQLGRR